jgi:hypothetical protein
MGKRSLAEVPLCLEAQEPSHAAHRAVSLGFLLEFTETHDCWEMTTRDVMMQFVAPVTSRKENPIRYTELLDEKQVGTVTVFVSHTWSNPWGLVVGVARKFASEFKEYHPGKELYFWIDLFAIHQHTRCDNIRKIDILQLEAVVKSAVNVLLVCDERVKPLTRVWCLFEIAITLPNGNYGKLQPRCGRLEGRKFVPIQDGDTLRAIADEIDLEKAEATVESDREMIFEMVKKMFPKQGLYDVNRIVKRLLRKGWS